VSTDLAESLRAKGLQVTAQRLAVLRAVHAVPHGTADAISEAVRAEIGAISRQAVYDALRVLDDNQLIRRIQPAGSPSLYDPRVGDNHHHVICRKCNKTVDIDCTVGAAPCLTAADTDFQVDEAEVIFWGTCTDCLKQTSQT
jgi:Fur family transcriptional regulator, stress-responsive regulator